jgi:nucleoside-diphosphate-sugar epimerase
VRVLVTGATGFVGAVLVPELVRRYGEKTVDAFVLPGEDLPESWRDAGLRIFRGDIADEAAVRAAVDGHSHVVHLAGFISYWRGDEERLRHVNEDGVRAVVEASLASGVERLIHISSVGAIGFHKDGRPADETTPFNWPEDILYMASKRRGQAIVERAVRERGLRAVILNPASIMGPGDHEPATPHNAIYRRISPAAWPSSTSAISSRSSSRPSRGGGATASATSSSGPTCPTGRSSGASPGPAAARPFPSPCRRPCSPRPAASSSVAAGGAGRLPCSPPPTAG